MLQRKALFLEEDLGTNLFLAEIEALLVVVLASTMEDRSNSEEMVAVHEDNPSNTRSDLEIPMMV